MISLKGGNCHGQPELVKLFFSVEPEEQEKAKAICNDCSVIYRCRAWAIDNPEEQGVWGGLTEEERRRQRRLSVSILLEEWHEDSYTHNTQHEQSRPADGFLFSLSCTSFQPMQNPWVFGLNLAFQFEYYTFDIAS